MRPGCLGCLKKTIIYIFTQFTKKKNQKEILVIIIMFIKDLFKELNAKLKGRQVLFIAPLFKITDYLFNGRDAFATVAFQI